MSAIDPPVSHYEDAARLADFARSASASAERGSLAYAQVTATIALTHAVLALVDTVALPIPTAGQPPAGGD